MKNIKIKDMFKKAKFKTMKNAPTILVVAGTVGVVTSGVLACLATLKVSAIMEEHNTTLETINEISAENNAEKYSEEDAKKDKMILCAQTTLKVVKVYAPAVILGGLSIAAMIQSNRILNRRNVALAAALTTTTETFSRYRKSVVDKYGERVDYELRHGIKAEKVTSKDENGKTQKETIDVIDANPTKYSDYARFYDDGCEGWSKDPEYNLMFLKTQQQYANDKLIADGFLFLNDVYDMLGIPKTKAGQVVGWVHNLDNPVGDNYVDFGVFDVHKQGSVNFVNGYERTILLDFNVDGDIWSLM